MRTTSTAAEDFIIELLLKHFPDDVEDLHADNLPAIVEVARTSTDVHDLHTRSTRATGAANHSLVDVAQFLFYASTFIWNVLQIRDWDRNRRAMRDEVIQQLPPRARDQLIERGDELDAIVEDVGDREGGEQE